MAQITLSSEEVEPGILPSCCIVCGTATKSTVAAPLSWVPSWTYLLLLCGFWPFAIVYLICRRSMTVNAPVCSRHRRHFAWRRWFLPVGLLITLVILFSSVAMMTEKNTAQDWGFFEALATFSGSLIGAAALSLTGVRATTITHESITLVRVAPEFVAALEADRAEYARRKQEWRDRRNQAPE